MKRLDRLALFLFALLALLATALAARAARRLETGGALRLELGRVRPTALSARTLERFARLRERLIAVYYVSPPERMPAGMRRMESGVTDLLEALRERFPERFDYQVVDPESRAGLEGFSARRRVVPFRVRSVARDAWSERTVWSTLSLTSGSEALLSGLRPEHLPHLQELIVGWLDELESPRKPSIALAAPADESASFEELADELALRGTLERVDLDAGAAVPEVDVLFWMRPARVSGVQLRGLERLLASGGSAVVAGSPWRIREEEREGVPYVAFERAPVALDELAAHFGLAVEPGLVLDTTCEELEFASGKVPAAHWIRCIAPDQDFHRFAGQPNGTLLFRAPGPFTPVPARLRELGWTADVLAATTDGAWVASTVPAEPVELATLKKEEGSAVAKQALIVGLQHDDPWRGELVFCASDTPFADGFYHRPHTAHPRLADVLLDQTASPERLVRAGVELEEPEPLPALGPMARSLWRVFGVGLPVAVLVALALSRGLFSGKSATGGALVRSLRRRARVAGMAALAAALALGLVRGARALELELDFTGEGLNELAGGSRAIARRAREAGEVRAELFVSDPARLPPALRGRTRELEDRLADFRAAGARLALERVRPEDLDEERGAALAAAGVVPYQGATVDEEVTRVTRFFCALRLARGERALVLGFPDARAFERLEFRLAFALERLGGLAAPRVAFASDVPRLSAAEAFEQFQQKGLFAPRGTDVYALARASLERNDLAVTHVNPRAPALPADADVLVWLQPRRSIEPMLEETVRTLHGGGRVVLAAQHFNIEAQQFRGGDFEPQYWPQPQTPDVDALYFPELTIELVREVLFDALSVPIATESEVTGRRGGRDVERQQSALPFQIRAAAASMAPHPITAHLGDQAFLWASRLRWDEAKLSELGITATPLVYSSERTWSFAWKGGWVPHELLEGPVALKGCSGEVLGPQVLAALFEGQFPRPAGPLELNPTPAPEDGPAQPGPDEPPYPAPAPGKLVFIGDSELFQNERLADPDFRGDHLLWNAVATLAFEPELAELATRARVPRGFGYVAPRARLLWRAAVVGGGPAALVLAATLLSFLRRRARVLVP